MADWNLINYAINQKRAGFKDDQLSAYLLTRGYDKKTIDEVIFYANKHQKSNPSNSGISDNEKKQKKNPMIPILLIVFLFLVIGIAGYFLKDFFTGEGARSLSVESGFETQTAAEQTGSPEQDSSAEEIAVPAEETPVEQIQEEAEDLETDLINETVEETETEAEITEEEPVLTVIPAGTYTNDDLQISLSYPDYWDITETTKTIAFSLPITNENNIKSEIKISRSKTTPTSSTLSSFTDWMKRTFAFPLTQPAMSTTIGNEPANMIEQTVTSGSGETALVKKTILYTVIHKEYGYYIYYLGLMSDYTPQSTAIESMIKSISFTG